MNIDLSNLPDFDNGKTTIPLAMPEVIDSEKVKRVISKEEADFKKEVKDKFGDDYPIASFSRLDSLDGCLYSFKKTYIDRNRGDDNIYSFIGSKIHDLMENLYNGMILKEDIYTGTVKALREADVLGLKFPNDNIRAKYEKNIINWAKDVSYDLDGMITAEKVVTGFIGENKNIPIIGYIDIMQYTLNQDMKGECNILDWKTSSKFSKADLRAKGRQLILYKELLNGKTAYPVRGLYWRMLKYIEVPSKFKGKTKVVDYIEKDDYKEYKQYTQEYDYTQEDIDELHQWVEIQWNKYMELLKNKDNPIYFMPWDIKKNSFFCGNLCGHKRTCEYYQKYKIENGF